MVDLSLAPASLRTGLRVYAVGDVHGCLDKLTALHAAIAEDLARRPAGESVLIHLGDYVDRGRESAGVIGLLAGTVLPRVDRRVDLQGNHEVMMLGGLTGAPGMAQSWLGNGGDATLESYGVSPGSPPEGWAAGVTLAHQDWIKRLDLTHQEGGYLFVHAGIRPGRQILAQTPSDLLWIREPFLSSQAHHPLVVVHGHTPVSTPVVRSNRIGIDTGAALGGCLTCLVLEDDRLGFLSI